MAIASRTRRRGGDANYWPGFVDALATLLLVFVFLLVVFVLAQIALNMAISGKDEALERLSRQVNELSDLLDLERQANAELRLSVAQMSGQLQSAVSERDDLVLQLRELRGRAEVYERRATEAEARLAEAEAKLTVGKEALELRLAELVSLRQDIAALRQLRAELESEVGDLSAALQLREQEVSELTDDLEQTRQRNAQLDSTLATARSELGALRDRSKTLEARLADERERTLLAQREIDERDIRIEELFAANRELDKAYAQEKELTTDQKALITTLNAQIEALRDELKKITALLDEAERKDELAQVQIADLGRRLNRALAGKVEELSRYRSEFFGRLREILGERQDVRIVGDRFVFQSEVLFATGSAELGPEGQDSLSKFAQTLLGIAEEIPDDINWILRVDGHTDKRPIATYRFPSNWELSAARAISVTKFLEEQGVPPERLAATGFAAYQPLDDREDEIAYRRNRRIEMKLTER